MSASLFRRSTLRWLIGTSVVSFLVGLALMILGPDLVTTDSRAADCLSSSAIGHRAFVEVLRELDVPVIVSRHATLRKAGPGAVLVVAEPRDCPLNSPRARSLERMLGAARGGLLVLPKWEAKPHPRRSDWVVELELIRVSEGEDALRAVGVPVAVRQFMNTLTPRSWDTGPIGHVPSFPLPTVQLLTGPGLRPLVSCPLGTLLGAVDRPGRPLLVLSDPDVLCNAGLGQGANAAFMVAVIEHLGPRDGPVVFDETIHGHEREPSIWRELFTFPLVVIVLHAALVLVVLLAAGMRRFGAPQRPTPALEPGHRFLIENTADLLRYRGQPGAALMTYFKTTLQRVRVALRAPRDIDARALEAWLDRLGETRGTTDRVRDLQLEARAVAGESSRGPRARVRLVRTADRIHRWREEILHGPSDRTQHS